MIPLAIAEIAAITHGTPHDVPDGGVLVTAGMDFDHRLSIQPGGIFLAVVGEPDGEHIDGHDHAADAVKAGSVLVLATRPVGVPALVVDDVLAAAGMIASHLAARLPAQAIGITGSNGKTSTKDLAAHVLAAAGVTVATSGSRNSRIGTPQTISRADTATRFLVLEMGARRVGHLKMLTSMVPLDVAAVLNVGSAHMGRFGGREAIVQAKGELVEGLRPDGLAVLNADDPAVRAMASRTRARVVLTGLTREAHVRAERVSLDAHARAGFELVTPQGRAPVSLQLVGDHQVANALVAAAIGREAGLSVDQIADRLSTAVPTSRWRMEVTERADGVTVVNDAYNANPESMAASLAALAAMTRGGRQAVAVLGEMCELGASSEREHVRLGELVAEHGIRDLITVGKADAQATARAARRAGVRAVTAEGPEAAYAALQLLLRDGDIVLVKASRSGNLQTLAERLQAESAREAAQG